MAPVLEADACRNGVSPRARISCATARTSRLASRCPPYGLIRADAADLGPAGRVQPLPRHRHQVQHLRHVFRAERDRLRVTSSGWRRARPRLSAKWAVGAAGVPRGRSVHGPAVIGRCAGGAKGRRGACPHADERRKRLIRRPIRAGAVPTAARLWHSGGDRPTGLPRTGGAVLRASTAHAPLVRSARRARHPCLRPPCVTAPQDRIRLASGQFDPYGQINSLRDA